LLLLGLQICVDEYFETGNPLPGPEMFLWVMGRLDLAIFLVFLITLVSTPVILTLTQLVHHQKLGVCSYLPIYGLIQVLIYSSGLYACYFYKLPPGSSMVLSAETARISMKVHAYFREKMLNGVNKDSK
jgi:hypothetical protein